MRIIIIKIISTTQRFKSNYLDYFFYFPISIIFVYTKIQIRSYYTIKFIIIYIIEYYIFKININIIFVYKHTFIYT